LTVRLIVQMLLVLASIIEFVVIARLSLALPAMALARDDVTFGAAWDASRGNSWRVFWAYMFCILPWGAIGGGFWYWLFARDHSRAGGTLLLLINGLLWIPIGMISVGMLSLAYRHFFERSA
jgi:hypothetical protein